MNKFIFKGILILFVLFNSVEAQNNIKIRVLFLGNSYTSVNNLPQLIHNIALANGDTLVYEDNCPGGYTLYNHYTDATSISKINSQAWDYVVLQAQSQEPSFSLSQVASQTLPFAIKLDSVINQNDSCTITVFFETWGRKHGDISNCPFYPPVCTYTGMQNRLKESYKLFADTCQAIMSPAGEAWRKSIGLDSTLNLYQSDESHPSLEGSYLTACVFYEVLFNKSVLLNTFTAGILSSTVSFLQQVAHDVVADSLLIWNIGIFNPCDTITSIKGNMLHEDKILFFPNPAYDFINMSFTEGWINKPVSYKILDVLGKVYIQNTFVSDKISVSELPEGIYFLQLNFDEKILIGRFIKR